VGELTGYRDETTEQPDLGDRRHGRSDVIAVHSGGSSRVGDRGTDDALQSSSGWVRVGYRTGEARDA
jgi:hypothetical protein